MRARTAGFLSRCVLALGLAAAGGCAWIGQEPVRGEGEPVGQEAAGPVIEPELERRDVRRAAIDTEDCEASLYAGVLQVEDFGSNPSYGFRLAYHVSEDLFLEAEYSRSEVSDSSFRNLGAPVFESEDEDLEAYGIAVGYHVLPGEVFMGSGWARASSVYLLFGAGNTEFVGEDNTTYLLGFGLRTLATDWFSLRLEARDRIFESDLLGDNEWKHNFEIGLALGVFF